MERIVTQTSARIPARAIVLFMLVLGVFVGGGLYSGWLFLHTARAFIQAQAAEGGTITVTDLVNVTRSRSAAVPTRAAAAAVVAAPAAVTTPAPPPPEEQLPPWNGRDRVTVLLLGIDQREDEKGLPTRSDTMILVTMDPVNLTGAMLSLPRDLWVPIDRKGNENKLNTAHFFGELEKPGSGPQSARWAIQYNLGVPINYTARVDFHGFERLVDAVGGVTVDVDRAILDDEYPNEKYGVSRIFVPAGPQRMNGVTALRYARSRHADSDFGRIRRQQKVLQAAREEALSLNVFTLTKLPRMIQIVLNSVTTDIPPQDLPRLAWLGQQIQSGAIASRAIDDTMIVDQYGDGTYLIPDREKIRQLVGEVFYDPAVKKEAARVELLNGTTRDGLATRARSIVQPMGVNVIRVDGAARTDYRESVILDYRGDKKATAEKLASALRLPKSAVRTGGAPTGQADVTVILGADYRPS